MSADTHRSGRVNIHAASVVHTPAEYRPKTLDFGNIVQTSETLNTRVEVQGVSYPSNTEALRGGALVSHNASPQRHGFRLRRCLWSATTTDKYPTTTNNPPLPLSLSYVHLLHASSLQKSTPNDNDEPAPHNGSSKNKTNAPTSLTSRLSSWADSLASLSLAAADPSSAACNDSHASRSRSASRRAPARAASAAATAAAALARSVSRAHLEKEVARRRPSYPDSAAAVAPTSAAAATAPPTLNPPVAGEDPAFPVPAFHKAEAPAVGVTVTRRLRAGPEDRDPGPPFACVEASARCLRSGLYGVGG